MGPHRPLTVQLLFGSALAVPEVWLVGATLWPLVFGDMMQVIESQGRLAGASIALLVLLLPLSLVGVSAWLTYKERTLALVPWRWLKRVALLVMLLTFNVHFILAAYNP